MSSKGIYDLVFSNHINNKGTIMSNKTKTENDLEKYVRQSDNFLKQAIPVFQSEGYFGLADQCAELRRILEKSKIEDKVGGDV